MMPPRFGLILLATLPSWLLATSLAYGQSTSKPTAAVSFDQQIKPLLAKHCLDCHGPDEAKAALRLDTMLGALRGGDSGESVIQPGNSQLSHIIERVSSDSKQLRMPPDGQPALASAEIELLKQWIDDAAAWKPIAAELAQRTVEHWSFQPIAQSPIPHNGTQHPIDAFIQNRLARDGLTLSARADKRQLIRRLYLVMLGLPPTPSEVEQFEQDTSSDAWERLIDRVLASPRYGERWAMHWLDLIRFGETNGFETNRERPFAYPFRDWVIAALNQDKPYDAFVREQIAGDQLGEPVATGFLVSGPNDIVKGQDKLLGLMQRQDELSDIVNTVGTAFLGLTTGCARCHNHKFDPITQTDFYALQAVFAGVQHADRALPLTPEQTNRIAAMDTEIASRQTQLASIIGVKQLRAPVSAKENIETFEPAQARFVRFTIDKTNAAEPCIDELQVFADKENIALASRGAKATSSGDFEHPLHKLEHINDGQFGNSRSWIASTPQNAWVQIELPHVALIDRIVWGRDQQGKFADRLATRYKIDISIDGEQWTTVASARDRRPLGNSATAEFDLSGLDVAARDQAESLLKSLSELETARKKLAASSQVYCGTFSSPPEINRLFRGDPTAPREVVMPDSIASLGKLSLSNATPEPERRLAIANWIVRRDHPLTARVITNRIWQFHFGTGIVDTPSDFGANGTPPMHPELLDWLASDLVSNDWSLKRLHRWLLTSAVWQQSSAPRADCMALDAQSRLLWRFPPRRLEAEPIRDCLVCVTGQIDNAIGGPGFSAFEVELENVRHYFPKKEYGPADWRRMVYMTKVRQEKDSVFGVFDCPDASQVTPKRSRSTTPLQALNLLNSRFALQQAELLAERLTRERSELSAQVSLAFQLCFNREASGEENAASITFVNQHGLVQFARALLNSNEFVFIP